jgi:hypothetical protein
MFSSGFLACTNYFNLHVFTKYFPDRSIPSILKKINVFLSVIGFAIGALLVLIIIAGSREEFNGRDRSCKIAI